MTTSVTIDKPVATPSRAILEVEHLSVSYGKRTAIDDVTFRLSQGVLMGLVGPNGAGKTTLIRAILRLLPTISGIVRVAGKTGTAAARNIGYVPQRHEFAWDYPISVQQVVLSGLTGKIGLFRRVRPEHWQGVYRALSQVGLSDLRDRTVGELSGGQRQRVLLARALAANPPLLILDEPYTGLDQPTIELLAELLRQLADSGTSIFMSTHDIPGAMDTCDELLMLHRSVRACGAPRELMSPQLWMDTYSVSAHSPLMRSIGLAAPLHGMCISAALDEQDNKTVPPKTTTPYHDMQAIMQDVPSCRAGRLPLSVRHHATDPAETPPHCAVDHALARKELVLATTAVPGQGGDV
ncbi:MAG: anchored repeat-type ABC transporter ATP-binding subunit [Actinomycetaceae bacterium]|nr:anchored repeat-type ABC transporter ATP-binding subunit [Actinomycetaceae bacterium]